MMKKKIFNIVKVVAFIIILGACLTTVSKILQYEHEMEPDITMKEFYGLEENSVQVLVLGSSHTTIGFSPMECYKNTQITSFNLSTAKQPIEVAYHLLIEGLKTQSPEVVIYDVASLLYKKSEVTTPRFRYLMDSMPLSLNKVNMAIAYANYNEGVRTFSIGEALSPIYYYHDRWKEIDEEEMCVDKAIPHLYGQVIRTNITEINFDMEKFDAKEARKIEENPDSAPAIRDNNLDYLLKIKKLCDDNDIELLLTSTPTNRWTSTKKQLIEEVCDEYEIDFLDMNLPDGKVIDYSTDMADGNHVNSSGALKTTKYLYEYIIDNYGLKGNYNQNYENSLKYYNAYYDNMAYYAMETDFNEYMSLLMDNKEKITVFITAKGEITQGLQSEDVKQLQQLGCTINFDKSNYENSYIAVVDGGKLTYEEVGQKELTGEYILGNGAKASLYSNGQIEGSKTSIKIDDKNYAINSAGINIVVYDKESGVVVDSVSFNTHYSQKDWYRTDERSLELFMVKSYRTWVSENY